MRPCHVGMVIRQIVCTVRFARNDFFFLDHFGNEQGRRWFVFVGDCGGSIESGSANVVGHDFCRFCRRRFTGCAPHCGAVVGVFFGCACPGCAMCDYCVKIMKRSRIKNSC